MFWLNLLKVGDLVVLKQFSSNGADTIYSINSVDAVYNGEVCVGEYVFRPNQYAIFTKDRWICLLNPADPVIQKLVRDFESGKDHKGLCLGT